MNNPQPAVHDALPGPQEPDHRPASASARRLWWPAALIPLLACIVFAPGLGNGFVHWDDYEYIGRNPLLVRPDGLVRIWTGFETPQYYPLTFSTFWLEFRLWGVWPGGYYLVNVLLHAANALLVFLLMRSVGAERGTAWLVGALFAVHPLQVGSVAWLPERKNVLAMFWALLAALAYLRNARTREPGYYAAAIGAFALALLSKTAVVTLPLSLMAAEWLVLGKRGWRPFVRSLPLLALAGAAGLITIMVERRGAPVTAELGPQPLVAAAALWAYIGKVLWPATLLPLYPEWDTAAGGSAWWLPAFALVVVAAAVWRSRGALGELPVWGLAHFVALLLPSLGLIPFGFLLKSPIGDQLVYFALPGLVLALVCWGASLGRALLSAGLRRPLAYAVGGALLFALGAKTVAQVQLWHDGERLWSHQLAHDPRCTLAWNNLGAAQGAAGKLAEALRSHRNAVMLAPNSPMTRVNLGITLRKLGRLDEAVDQFRALTASAPRDPAAWFNLGWTLALIGRNEDACAAYAEAVRLNPRYVEAYVNWGMALAAAGDAQGALAKLETARDIDPRDPTVPFNQGIVWAALNRPERAVMWYREALALEPGSAQIYTNLGLAHAALGQRDEAVAALHAALERDPRNELALLNLGALAAQARRPREAEQHFRAALAVRPESVAANSNLGTLLAQQGRHAEALPYLTQAVRLEPGHANAHFMLGLALLALGRPQEAVEHLARATELRPDDAEAFERLAAAHVATSQPAAAQAAAAEALHLAQANGDRDLLKRLAEHAGEYGIKIPATLPAATSGPTVEPASAPAGQPS